MTDQEKLEKYNKESLQVKPHMDEYKLYIDSIREKCSIEREKIKDKLDNSIQQVLDEIKITNIKMNSVVLHQTETRIKVESISKSIEGNGKEGIRDKVDRHQKYFYMVSGAAALISVSFTVVKVLI